MGNIISVKGPNYENGSILNLMSSISKALGKKSKYSSLKLLDPKELGDTTNLVVIIIDGLGYDYFRKNSAPELKKYLRGKITSVFPSVTSAAMTSFSTGLAPVEHEMTGWYTYLKEIGSIIIPLPYIIRSTRNSVEKTIKISKIFNLIPFTKGIRCNCYKVYPKEIVDSVFSKTVAGNSKRISYTTIKNFFTEIKKAINLNKNKKFIFAYYPNHDSLSHKYGSESKKVADNFKKVQKELINFIKKIEGTNTTVIITADHGIIDVPRSRVIDLKDHPKLKETLRLPLCGDFRYSYCYVKPEETKEFEYYVKTKLEHCCKLYKSNDLAKKNFFGLSSPSKIFLERIGDYIIIMKENYAIYDFLDNEKPKYNIGDHGGLSRDEMLVPLIVIKR